MYAALGVPRVYTTTATDQKFALADYEAAVDKMRELGEIARRYEVVAMMEFVRTSSFVSTLPTVLRLTRGAPHPNRRPMLDCYHFLVGPEQDGRSRSDPARRDRTCSPGCT